MKPGLIIAISLFAVSLSSQAATLSMESCASIENPAKRLACYDKLARRLPADTVKDKAKDTVKDTVKASDTTPRAVEPVAPRAEVAVPAAAAVPKTAPAAEPAPDAVAIFGLENKQRPGPKEKRPDKLQFKWAKKKRDPYGDWIITLENGQVWHQIGGNRFYFANPEHLVVISRGVLNSFFMAEPGRSNSIRVERIK